MRCFLAGCFEIDSLTEEITWNQVFQTALHSKNLRAMEFILGQGSNSTYTLIEIDGNQQYKLFSFISFQREILSSICEHVRNKQESIMIFFPQFLRNI